MYVLTDSRVKTILIAAVVILSVQLLLGTNLIYGQTANRPNALGFQPTPPVSKLDITSTNRAVQNQNYLSQLRGLAARNSGNTESVTNAVDGEMSNLEWTGHYVERFVRVPEGDSGKAKLIRFLIPVYREKGTQRKTSVGTEDKQKKN